MQDTDQSGRRGVGGETRTNPIATKSIPHIEYDAQSSKNQRRLMNSNDH
jgi:hypothetical protein